MLRIMKKKNQSILIKSVLLIVMQCIVLIAFAQENRIWLKVPSFEALKIDQTSEKLRSNNAKLDHLMVTYRIRSIQKAVPGTKVKSLNDLYEVECDCDANDLLVQVARLNDLFLNPEIGPNYQTMQEPDDINLAFPYDYALHLIKAPEAWGLTNGDSSIRIAISDAGYVFSHPELMSKVDVISPNIVQSNTAHGTAVAIAAAGATNNSYGKSSVGYASRLELRGMNYNELLEASYSGARIVNASWAASCFHSDYAQQIINEIHNNGTVIIAAAGNGSTCGGPANFVYPASYEHVISVTSVGPANNHERTIGNLATTHQHNNKVDICAPGYDVALSTATNVFTTGNGTSFAAPMVSGAVALILAVNPCLTPDNVEFILKSSADTISNFVNPGYRGRLGVGRLDVEKAVQMAMKFNTMSATVELRTVCAFNEQYLQVENISGMAPYTVSWSNGDFGMIGLIGAPGEYSVLIKDSLGCVFYQETTVVEYEPISIQGSMEHVSCFGAQNGFVELQLNGGDGEYFINWSNGSDQLEMAGLSAGFYHVSITDGKGCSKTESFEITSPDPLLINLDVQHPNEFTLGSVEVEVTGGTPSYSYAWSNGMSTEDLYDFGAGVYQLTVTDANGCTTSKLALLHQQSVAGIEQAEKIEMFVYPNPTNGIVTMTFQMQQAVQVAVYTINGQRVLTENNFNSGDQLNLTGLADGVYQIEMQLGNTIRRAKIVVAN